MSQYLTFLNCEIIELDWFQSVQIHENKITLIPSRHYSNRFGKKF